MIVDRNRKTTLCVRLERAARTQSDKRELKAELAGGDAVDESGPLLGREGQRSNLGSLGVANQVRVRHLGDLNAGAARAPGALDPFRRIDLVHCGLLSRMKSAWPVRYYKANRDAGFR